MQIYDDLQKDFSLFYSIERTLHTETRGYELLLAYDAVRWPMTNHI